MIAVSFALSDFFNSTKYYFDILDPRAHTQMNESVNELKGRLAGKGYAWKSFFALRMSFVVRHMNDSFRYFVQFVEKRGPVPPNRSRVEAFLDRARKARSRPRIGRRFNYSFTSRLPSSDAKHPESPILGTSTRDHDDFSQLQALDSDSSDRKSVPKDDMANDTTFLDLSGCQNERSYCHLNAILISLFPDQAIREFLKGPFPLTIDSMNYRNFIEPSPRNKLLHRP
jgi:hypothetical protein